MLLTPDWNGFYKGFKRKTGQSSGASPHVDRRPAKKKYQYGDIYRR